MVKKVGPSCGKCAKVACQPNIKASDNLPVNEAPEFCPMKKYPDLIQKAFDEYQKEENIEFTRLASVQEFECYERTPEGLRTKFPRIEELFLFAQKLGYKNLGVAFCNGLSSECRMLTEILENKGFEVVSVRCKVGGIAKEKIGILPEQKIRGYENWESMCNPIAQAMVLNAEKVDMAILLGLCIGHDTQFIKYCQVPMTVLAVKDRVTGHNPLAALYLSNTNFYKHLQRKI